MLNLFKSRRVSSSEKFRQFEVPQRQLDELDKKMLNYPNEEILKGLSKEDLLSLKNHYGLMRDALMRVNSNRPTVKEDYDKFLTPLKWNALSTSSTLLQEYLRNSFPHYLNFLRREYFNASISTLEVDVNKYIEYLNKSYSNWGDRLDPITLESFDKDLKARFNSLQSDFFQKHVRARLEKDPLNKDHYLRIR